MAEIDRNFTDVIAAFEQKFSGANPPSQKAIYKLNNRFEERGSMNDLLQIGCHTSLCALENMDIIAVKLVKSLHKFERKASKEFNISDQGLRRMLPLDLKLKPYRPNLL